MAMPKRPIVLLHGAGGSYESTFVDTGWVGAIEAAGRRAIGLDLPGHNCPRASRNPGDYADLTGLVMSGLPPDKFDAIGFSLGGKLLLELAIRLPDRIGRLVLGGVGDNVFAPESVAEAVADALERGPSHTTPPAVLAFLSTWKAGRTEPLALAAVLRRPPNPVFSQERLAQIGLPILIVNGERDPVAAMSRQLTNSLANARITIVPDTGHFDLPGQPLFRSAALAFLSDCNGTDAMASGSNS
jgi:pimeloyl-ACP methyl ester carboxylesterase